jgi:hypothetical protein
MFDQSAATGVVHRAGAGGSSEPFAEFEQK